MEWNGHCTHPTHVSKHCSIWVELATYYNSFLGVATGDNLSNYKSSTPCSIICLGLNSTYVLFTPQLHQCRSAMSHLVLYFLFSSIVCGILRGSLQEHDGAIPTRSNQLHSKNTMVPYQLPLRFTSVTAEKYTCINFSIATFVIQQITNVLTVQHMNTYIHTYIQIPLACNTLMWGSLRLTPISSHSQNITIS